MGKTVILYESPYRIAKFMSFVAEEFGTDTEAVIARELTKVHEEFISGTAGEIAERVNSAGEIKGEIAVMLRPAPGYGNELPLPDRDSDSENGFGNHEF